MVRNTPEASSAECRMEAKSTYALRSADPGSSRMLTNLCFRIACNKCVMIIAYVYKNKKCKYQVKRDEQDPKFGIHATMKRKSNISRIEYGDIQKTLNEFSQPTAHVVHLTDESFKYLSHHSILGMEICSY